VHLFSQFYELDDRIAHHRDQQSFMDARRIAFAFFNDRI